MKNVLEVLVIDSDEDSLQRILGCLHSENCRITIRRNAREAIDALRDFSFDLVLTGLTLPEDAYNAFLRTLRRNFPEVAIIVLLSTPDAPPMSHLLNAGADGHFSKPFRAAHVSLLCERDFWKALSREDWWGACGHLMRHGAVSSLQETPGVLGPGPRAMSWQLERN